MRRRFDADVAVIGDPALERALRDALHSRGARRVARGGRAALVEVAQAAECDTVLAAIVGAAGLQATLAAAESGKRLLLANKEAIVCAGALLMAAVQRGGSVLLPVDSEHNAIHQCLAERQRIRARRCAADTHGLGRTVPESRRSRRCDA